MREGGGGQGEMDSPSMTFIKQLVMHVCIKAMERMWIRFQ